MWIKNIAKRILCSLFALVPVQNRILLESTPCYADNTRAVFDEMIRRGWNQSYQLIWMYQKKEEVPDIHIPNVKFCCFNKKKPFSYLYAYYLMNTAKLLVCCNNMFNRLRENQYAIYLAHGAALKDCRSHAGLSLGIDEFLSFSTYLAPYDAENLHVSPSKALVLGYPRLDSLFQPPLDMAKLFPEASFQKMIYWLPTYRQNWAGTVETSNISMPIIYDEQIALEVNACAKRECVLLVIKPHFAQDLSKIKAMHLSNLVFIDEAFLKQRGLLNYDLLRSSDAMLSDYSSVYYDYLLLDRPIGLCWDDYDEYTKREGIIVDQDVVLAGGEKIYNADDLCAFIVNVAAGNDPLGQKRRAVRDLIHDYQDAKTSERVVDYLAQKLQAL